MQGSSYIYLQANYTTDSSKSSMKNLCKDQVIPVCRLESCYATVLSKACADISSMKNLCKDQAIFVWR